MYYKWTCGLVVSIGIVCCECAPQRLSAKENPNDQEKLLFLLDQIRSHSEQLKSGECTISGRMYAPEQPGKTILVDKKFEIRHSFVRPLKCRWEGWIPGWQNDPKKSGVDDKGNLKAGSKFDGMTVLFATNGPDAAFWDSARSRAWISVWPRSKAEERLDRFLYFPDLAYLTLYTAGPRRVKTHPDEIIDYLKKWPNLAIDDSGPVWKIRWTMPLEGKDSDFFSIMEVDTEKGFTVTSFTYFMRRNGKAMVQDQVTAKWRQQNGVYVPIHYTTQLGTKESGNYTTTEADINWSSVNAPLEDSLFEWGSLKVPEGTRVLDSRRNPPIFVENGSASNASPSTIPTERKWLLIGTIVFGIAVIAILLVMRHLRRRSSLA